MLKKLLYLESGDLKRLLPFFGFYLLVFLMINIGDGLSLSLFVHKVGARQLPQYYALTAFVNILLVSLYIFYSEKLSNITLFRIILLGSILSFLIAWLVIQYMRGGQGWYGLFFISREISFTLIIMHFGTFLQDYFTREELNRVLPIIYSGGRIGGILGGGCLGLLTPLLGVMNLVLVYVGIGSICLFLLLRMDRFSLVEDPSDEQQSPASLPEFFQFLKTSPLLFWLSVTTVLFIVCRWILNFQYNNYFQHHFASEESMAEFLGWYTSLALIASLFIQVFVVNRSIAKVGSTGVHTFFSLLLVSALGINLFPMTMYTAVYSRLIETELRSGIRNPVIMLMTNTFQKGYRIRARAWLMGTVIPIATLLASILLQWVHNISDTKGISILGICFGVFFFFASYGLYGALGEKKSLKNLWQKPKEVKEPISK